MNVTDSDSYKRLILTRYDQISLFSHYLGINPSEIDYCLQSTSNKISNPLRSDPNPSLGFISVIDREIGVYKLRMHDFGDTYYRGDCFDIVGKIIAANANNGVGFVTVCKDIIATMEKTYSPKNTRALAVSSQAFIPIFVEPRLWNIYDINLWNEWGLDFTEIKSKVYPISKSYINSNLDYKYNSSDPGYAYVVGYVGNDILYKLYFPNRGRKKGDLPRFKGNNKYYPLEAINEMAKADILVITKSYKDRLLLKKVANSLHTRYSVEVTNVTSEGIILSDEFITKLGTIYQKIVTNFDFDYAGLKGSGMLKRKHQFERFMFTTGRWNTINFGGKDATDICKAFGYDYVSNLASSAYEFIERELDYQNDSPLY